MKRFQLTIVFVVFSAFTIGAGAIAVNALMASSAERSLLSLTERQSHRDARFIATLVGQLLAEENFEEGLNPPLFGSPSEAGSSLPFNTHSLQVNAPMVLDALDISDLAIYDTAGRQVWTSNTTSLFGLSLSPESLERTLSGEIVSGAFDEDAGVVTSGATSGDLVVSFVPLIGESSGQAVQILGVTRTVPSGVSGLLAESRYTVLRTTLISLSGVFLILLAFVLAADVRIWRRNERALAMERAQQERLAGQNRELNDLNESKNTFIQYISHELANPLSAMIGLLDVVLRNREGNITDTQIEKLGAVQRSSKRMDRLVNDLSDAARASSTRLEILPREFDIDEALADVIASISYDVSRRQQRLKLDSSGELGSMTGDRDRLIQVIYNLVSNASKYSPEDTQIRMRASTSGDELKIDVIDQGIGISSEEQDHIFDLFWRADNPSVKGAGIGLMLAKQVIDGHGGHISVESAPGSGTTMSFTVPMHRSEASEDQDHVESENERLNEAA